MRHFLRWELVPDPIAVPSLSRSLEPSGPRLHPVRCGCTTQGLTPADGFAFHAQPLSPIAATAETNLNPTPRAVVEPVLRRRQETPCRRFLDMEREP